MLKGQDLHWLVKIKRCTSKSIMFTCALKACVLIENNKKWKEKKWK